MQELRIKRVYEPPCSSDGLRVLVDRIWPRGLSKKEAAINYWAKDLAPSTELRRWFHHDPAKWNAFQERYREELEEQKAALAELTGMAGHRPITLLFGAKDTKHNQAIVLKSVLEACATPRKPKD